LYVVTVIGIGAAFAIAAKKIAESRQPRVRVVVMDRFLRAASAGTRLPCAPGARQKNKNGLLGCGWNDASRYGWKGNARTDAERDRAIAVDHSFGSVNTIVIAAELDIWLR
jgi:hypothetical protein